LQRKKEGGGKGQIGRGKLKCHKRSRVDFGTMRGREREETSRTKGWCTNNRTEGKEKGGRQEKS